MPFAWSQARLEGPYGIRTALLIGVFLWQGMHQGTHSAVTFEHLRVIQFGAVEHYARVGSEVFLRRMAEPAGSLGRRNAAQVPERGSSVAEVVRVKVRRPRRLASSRQRRPESVGAEAGEHLGDAASCGSLRSCSTGVQ